MTVRALLMTMLRRWYAVLAALLVAAAMTGQFMQDSGVHASKTTVVFTWPGTSTLMPYNGNDSWSLIAFAQTVATVVNDGRVHTEVYANSDAPLYGAGIREAVVVAVQEEGNQWSSSTSSATIEIQVVGRTRDWVQDQQDAIVARIESVAATEQRSRSVPEGDRIEVHVEPLTRAIEDVRPSRTARFAAFGAMAALGLLGGATAAWMLDRSALRRRSRARAGAHPFSDGGRSR
ncbi:hypothetical protein [Microbacterium flavescens]|jgi:hypothetical protein|uniref:hypothetical protein n=1 Tax=Microbacterium flavescens TaxID=69366 RepID=UPI001BDE6DB6|nr:hypothetical protein [Microbacterium flavescens]BFF09375.1 hypothetical protein GCM10025699_06780 [Microbacterium flavescens]